MADVLIIPPGQNRRNGEWGVINKYMTEIGVHSWLWRLVQLYRLQGDPFDITIVDRQPIVAAKVTYPKWNPAILAYVRGAITVAAHHDDDLVDLDPTFQAASIRLAHELIHARQWRKRGRREWGWLDRSFYEDEARRYEERYRRLLALGVAPQLIQRVE